MQHIYDQPQFGEDWFTFPNLYSHVVQKYDSGSTFVEVGSWKGRSSSYMCVEIANSQKNINFFCVDTWQGSREHHVTEDLYWTFMQNMAPVKNFFVPWKMTSLQAAKLFDDRSIDFVFIDASHEYQDVKNDICAWFPKVKRGGILAGHDYDDNWPGVKQAVNECFKKVVVNEGCWAVFPG
jgi:hypothetical protein